MESERFYAYTELRRWEHLPSGFAEAMRLGPAEPRHRCATAVAQHLGFDAVDLEPVTLLVFWQLAHDLIKCMTDTVMCESRCDELAHAAVSWLDLAEARLVACDLRLDDRRLPPVQIGEVAAAIRSAVGTEIGERFRAVVRISERHRILPRKR